MTKVLVIGGGFAGCCAAHLFSDRGWDVTVVERASFLGGGVKTHWYGGHPYTYGPRHFLTEDSRLFEFLNRYVPMRMIAAEHENLTYVERDSTFYTWPMHADDVDRMPDRDKVREELASSTGVASARNFEEMWVGSVGRTLYEKFAKTYSEKMWQVGSNTELDGFEYGDEDDETKIRVHLRSGPRAAWNRPNVISAFPLAPNGYDDYFVIATRHATVLLNTEVEAFDVENYRVKLSGEWRTYDIIVSAIPPELLLNNAFGPLRWMGRDFIKIVLPVEWVFPPNVIFLYYANEEPFTRIVEYKKFYRNKSDSSLLGLEIPSKRNKLYPFPSKKDQQIAQKYFDALPERVFSIGRLGSYRYIDVDDIIAQCLALNERL